MRELYAILKKGRTLWSHLIRNLESGAPNRHLAICYEGYVHVLNYNKEFSCHLLCGILQTTLGKVNFKCSLRIFTRCINFCQMHHQIK